MELEIDAGEVRGTLTMPSATVRLEDVAGAYVRLMDHRLLPELEGPDVGSEDRQRCAQLHEVLVRWLDVSPGRILNRPNAQGSNGSKPFQAQIIRAHGLHVPETLVTNDPDAIAAFRELHGRLIYKSVSGCRSIVRMLTEDDLRRIDRVRWCPVQFQEYVDGVDVRVHVVGERVFATAIRSSGVDYRYAQRAGGTTTLEAVEIPDELAERCVSVSRTLGLSLSGIDLRIRDDGTAYCFEVNPSPAYTYYEHHTGQPIARAIAEYLARGAVGASSRAGGAPSSPRRVRASSSLDDGYT
jgi:hypothetical protein